MLHVTCSPHLRSSDSPESTHPIHPISVERRGTSLIVDLQHKPTRLIQFVPHELGSTFVSSSMACDQSIVLLILHSSFFEGPLVANLSLRPCSSHSSPPRTAKWAHGIQNGRDEVNGSAGGALPHEPVLRVVAVKSSAMARSHVKPVDGIRSLNCVAIRNFDRHKGMQGKTKREKKK